MRSISVACLRFTSEPANWRYAASTTSDPHLPSRRPTMKHTLSTLLALTLLLISSRATLANAPADEDGSSRSSTARISTVGTATRNWSVKDGTIIGQTTDDNPTKGKTFLIWRQGSSTISCCALNVTIVGGNSGIQYRSKERKRTVGRRRLSGRFRSRRATSRRPVRGAERGILASRGQKRDHRRGRQEHARTAGRRYQRVAGRDQQEDWNEYDIIAQGNHLIQKINGQVMAEVTDEQPSKAGHVWHPGPAIARR